jgi:arsenical pump membrane protein
VIIMAVPVLSAPLGRLSSPFALLVALPPLALALEAFGWQERLGARIAEIRPVLARLLAGYAASAATSAALTIDVAAVATASVGIAAASDQAEERRWQLGGAILGANVGSLLLPFSNLTNLVLVAATGMGFATYVGLAIWPELCATLAVGLLFGLRARRALASFGTGPEVPTRQIAPRESVEGTDHLARIGGVIAVAGAVVAVAFGLAGLDMAVPFAIAAGLLVGPAIASRRLDVGTLVRSIPITGLAIVGAAAIARGPIGLAAGALPLPNGTITSLVVTMAAGGLLAMVANNLPAVAFGAAWLARAHPATVVAYLIGTNVVAIATPHGSVATILARATGQRHGVSTPVGTYLRSAWPYAAIGALAGMVALSIAAR